jgi:hypothetical protein
VGGSDLEEALEIHAMAKREHSVGARGTELENVPQTWLIVCSLEIRVKWRTSKFHQTCILVPSSQEK